MMSKIKFLAIIAGTLLALLLPHAPAQAQATRTWVSGVGDDANPCSRTAPCKTFAGAISKTAAGGEINCLDPGGFGALTITKAITVKCPGGGEFGVLVSGTNGFNVAAGPTDKVWIEGLDFEGLNSGLTGINFTSGLELIIRDCEIHDFKQSGVNVASSTASARAVIEKSIIANNGTSGSANTGGVTVQGNAVTNIATILNSVMIGNQNYDVQVTGSANFAGLANDTLITGLSIVNSGNVISFGVPVTGNPANAGGSSVINGATNPTSHVPFN
jgi:hypothetical protein